MEFTRGDTYALRFQRKDSGGNVILEKADKIYFTVKKNYNTKSVLFQKTIDDMVFDENGYYHFTIKPEDTASLKYQTYVYDIEVKLSNYTATIAKGKIKLLQEATHIENEV